MMYNYWFIIWGVCSSYLTVLRRYKEQLLTCYLVCYFLHLSLVMMYHRCHMLVLGVLLHLETSTLFEICHKLVWHAWYQKKEEEKKEERKRKKKKKRERRSYTSHKSQNHYTTARAQDRCCCFFIDNVAFAKENTNKTYEAVINCSLAAPKIASLATDTEKQTNNYDQYQKSSFCKAKKQKQQTNRKLFTPSTFCNINTQGVS